jgi:hypothetical protein
MGKKIFFLMNIGELKINNAVGFQVLPPKTIFTALIA